MRLLLDENIPRPIVARLRSEGFDVEAIAEVSPSALDPDVLARAGESGRLLVTEDRDFGTLVYATRLPAPRGVVYLRLGSESLTEATETLLSVLRSGEAFEGWFTTVSRGGIIRKRPLPVRQP